MSARPQPLFRAEVIAYHERGLGSGNVVRHSSWVRRGYWAVLVAVAGAGLAAATIRVTPTVTLTVTAYRSPTVLTATASAAVAPPPGSAVEIAGDSGQVVAVSSGAVAGTYSMRVRLSRPLSEGDQPQQGVLRLSDEPLAVLAYRGLVGG